MGFSPLQSPRASSPPDRLSRPGPSLVRFLPRIRLRRSPVWCDEDRPDPRPVRPTPPRRFQTVRVPGAAPPELSLPGEPYPLSRVVASVRVRSPSFVRRGALGCFTIAFPTAPAREPGRRFLAVASPVASTHPKVRRTCRPLPMNAGLAVYERHARFEALLPPGVRSVRPSPRRARASRPVLSWGCRPPELSPQTTPGPVCRAGARAGLDTPATHVSGRPAFAVAGREPSTDPGFMNPGSVDAPRPRTGCALPSSCRPCPLSAAPRASLPFTPRSPAKGLATLDLEDAGLESSPPTPFFRSRRDPPFDRGGSVVGPPVTRGAGSRGFSSLVDRAPLRTRGPTQRALVSVTRARLTAPRSTRENF